MQEISNSLRQRLGARPQPQSHPDPDTLTAYIEQALPVAERGRVIEHLAECSDCREVVSLSQPELQPQQAVLQVPARSRWWIPAYRWGAVAATIAVAATLIVEKPWQTRATAPSAQTFSDKTANTPAPLQPGAGPANQAATTTQTPSVAGEPKESLRASARGIARNESAGTEIERGRNRRLAENPSFAAAPSPKAASPVETRSNFASIQSSSGAVIGAIAPTKVTGTPATSANQPKTPGAGKDLSVSSVNGQPARREAESASTATGFTADAASVLPAAPQPAAPSKPELRQYTPPLGVASAQNADEIQITPPNVASPQAPPSAEDNTLKTTHIGTGKKVINKISDAKTKIVDATKAVMESANPVRPPAAAQGFTGGAMAPPPRKSTHYEFKPKSSQQSQWTVTPEGHLLVKSDAVSQWHEAYTQSPDVHFRVVEPRGSEVWAGGNRGTLIHSWNGGVNWETFKVPDSGDITSISIDEDVQVKTSNGQTYVSTDQGKTWVPLQQSPPQ